MVTSIIIAIKINLCPLHYLLLLVGKVSKTINDEGMKCYTRFLGFYGFINIIKFLSNYIVEEVCEIIFLDFDSPYLLVHKYTVSAGNHSESRISFNSES